MDRVLLPLGWHQTAAAQTPIPPRIFFRNPTMAQEQVNNKPQAETLLSLVTDENCLIFLDERKKPNARILVGNHREIWPLRGEVFKLWLRKIYWRKEGKTTNDYVLEKVVSQLEARAHFDAPMLQLHNRVARHENAIWIDLCDKEGRAIRVTGEGWSVESDVPPLFRRHGQQQPLPIPSQNGDLKVLLPFLNFRVESQKLLVLAYIVACFVPDIPHPILHLHGLQGSRKSTLSRMLRRIVDPATPLVLGLPRKVEELGLQLWHHYFPFYDNASHLSGEISDALCRAVTGGGESKRQLFTDEEDVVFEFRRCVGINGINVVARKPDLLHRCILLELAPVTGNERKTEEEIWSEFDPLLPIILGGVMDALSGAIRRHKDIRLPELPRMADFALWGCAIAESIGYGRADFIQAYQENIDAQNEEALSGNAIGSAVGLLMEEQKSWRGTPSDLLGELTKFADDHRLDTRSRSWPKGAQALRRRLNEVQTNLLETGIRFTYGQGTHGKRFVELEKIATAETKEGQQKNGEGCGGCDDAGQPASFSRP